jgi:hypothetical protein
VAKFVGSMEDTLISSMGYDKVMDLEVTLPETNLPFEYPVRCIRGIDDTSCLDSKSSLAWQVSCVSLYHQITRQQRLRLHLLSEQYKKRNISIQNLYHLLFLNGLIYLRLSLLVHPYSAVLHLTFDIFTMGSHIAIQLHLSSHSSFSTPSPGLQILCLHILRRSS